MKNESGTEIAFGCVTAVVSVVVGAVLNGWVLSVLWGWFVVSRFHVGPIGVVSAMGLALTARTFVSTSSKTDTNEKSFSESVMTLFVFSVGYPLMVLGMGWLLRSFL